MMEKANVEAILNVGPAQRGMLYYCAALHPGEGAYVEQLRISLRGDLRPELLRRAWEHVVGRHGALRSLFLWEHREKPLQVVLRSVELPWEVDDWRQVPDAEGEARLAELLRRDRATELRLDRAPLLRFTVIRRPEDRWEVLWTFHHLLLDGWSIAVVLAELWTAYGAYAQGLEPALPPAPSLRDHAAWLSRQDEAADRAFWIRTLQGLDRPFVLDLPGGDPALVGEEGHADTQRSIDGEAFECLTAFTRSQNLTLNALAQGAWAVLLGRYAGASRVAFGSVASGRPPELPGVERLVGVLMNALPLWVEVPGGACTGPWLRELQETQAEAWYHGHRGLEQIQGWVGLPSREAPFESLVIYENYPAEGFAAGELPGLEITGMRMSERGAFPVSLYLVPRDGALQLRLDYRRDRLGDRAAEALMDRYLRTLQALAEDPERRLRDLPLETEEEYRLQTARSSGAPLPEAAGSRAVHELFADAARARPDALAVVDGARHTSYRHLAERAGAVAARLRALPGGVGPDDVIALRIDRSTEMLAGMLGILDAGAAYLPIDPATPTDRLAYMLEDAGARAVVTRRSLAGDAPIAERELVLLDEAGPSAESAAAPAPVAPESLAYVIYTSGSTGRPKGVLVSHRNLASYGATAAAEQAVGPGVRVLQFASIAFDTSAEEIWPCLTRGGTLVLRDDRALGAPAELAAALHEWRPEVLDLPTAFWHELAAVAASGELVLPESVRLVVIGGEKASGERLADWWRGLGERAAEVRLLNTYGPTEATIVAVATQVGEDDREGDPPLGGPIPGASAYVLGADLRLMPDGMAGELALGGAGVARGYLGRPALTAERFVPDPFACGPWGGRLYRTGDLAAFRPDGCLEFRGRIDGQLKVRGYRVEPGEVESVLASHPALREAAVVGWTPEGMADLRLAAYVVAAGGQEVPRPSALRAFVADRVPEYMVPSSFTALAELPRTTSGKVDRRALPQPAAAIEDGGGHAAPRTPVEELLAGWWADMLGLDRVSRDADFFRLGGHSLLVGRLAARVRKELGVDLPMIEVFQHPVLADLARRIAASEAGEETAAPALPPLTTTDRSRPLPLSYQQERVWFLNNLVPNTTAYNFQIRFWLEGSLDVRAFERALTEIVRRQEVLRTTFPEVDDVPVQLVHEPWVVELPVTDLSHLGREAAEQRAEEILQEEVSAPFDVTALPLIRWRLLRIADDLHQLVQVEHHFVHDGWSISLVLAELKALYQAFVAGEPSPLPELAFQYGDFAVWQRGWMRGEAMERIAGYWRRKLEGAPAYLDLPADRPRPARMTLQGDAIREPLPTDLYRGLRAFGRSEGFTLYMTMMAAFQALVHRHTGSDDFLIGTGIANRRVAELEPIVGMMVNSLVVRGDLGGDPTFRELLERVRSTTLEAYAHQDMPFERLVEELQPHRDPSRNPLFQVMFSFHDAAVPDLDLDDLRIGFLVEHNRTAKTDLNVIVAPRAEQRVGRTAHARDDLAMVTWEFSTDLFDRQRIERLIRHYYTLTAAALADPDRRVSELPLMPEDEAAQVLGDWSGRSTSYPRDRSLPELFARQVAADPGQPAVCFGGEGLSYGELDRRAAGIARRLRAVGVGRGTPVALALGRSADLVPAVLGVLRAGGCYVPLDTAYPPKRLAFMIDDAGAAVVVTDRASLGGLPDLGAVPTICLDDPEERERLAAPGEGPADPLGDRLPPPSPSGPDDPAYVVYTSGSTGRPKGVVVPHRAVARLVLEADFARFGPGETFLQLAPISFDAATLEIWAPLLTGGRLVVFPPEAPTLESLGEVLTRERVTTLWLTAGLFHQMVDGNLPALAPLRQLLAGGDVLSPDHCRRLLAAHPGLTLINGYGPTENTTFTACHAMASPAEVEDPVPVGRPVADTRVFVVDSRLRLVPVGVPGELVAGGDGLAHGYWRRPALTAERFVPDPFGPSASGEPGGRLYRTGDRVRWLPSGHLEFQGRLDTQVKVRGFRIEPGEVEAALAARPGVAEALVLPVVVDGDRALAAFVVPREGDAETLDPAGLREALAQRLPRYMVPQTLTVLDRLPLTPNGKVDRRALAETVRFGSLGEDAQRVAPRNPVEAALVDLWLELLPVDEVGVTDDFFNLGGHSLTATRMAARIRRDFAISLPLAVLFEEPTVERLALVLEAEGAAVTAPAGPAPAAAPGDEALSEVELDALLGRMLAEREA